MIPEGSRANVTESAGRPQTKLVYLDLNKWGDLAGAANGNAASERYKPTLSAARECVRKGAAVFPLSGLHLIELSKIGDQGRRRRIARLMTELSQGIFLASASLLIFDGLRNAVVRMANAPGLEQSVRPLTRDVFEMFDRPSEIHLEKLVPDIESSQLTELISGSPIALERMLTEIRLDRSFVDRWATFAQEHEQGRQIRWDLDKAGRKRAYCAIVNIGLLDRLIPMLASVGMSMKDLGTLGPSRLVAFFESVPVLDVEINLFTQRNEQRDRKIAPNDEIDISFLSVSIPYCDAVVTEKFWTSLARRLKLDAKYRTKVENDLTELNPFLDETMERWES